jgi:hypothetical protein
MTLDQIAQSAVDEVHDAHREARFTSTAPQARRSAVTPVILGAAFSLLAIVGIAFLANDPGDRAFTGPQSEPERPAEVIVFLPSDVEVGVADSIAIEVAGWPGVEFAAHWDSERALADFEQLFADQPTLIDIVREDPSILPASVRIWVRDGVDKDALADQARNAFPEAFSVHVITGTPTFEEVTDSPVTTQAEGQDPDSLQEQILTLSETADTEGSDFQAALLSDGVVTYAEYEEAVRATVTCIGNQGMQVFGPYPSSDGLLDFSYGGATTQEESAREAVLGNECEQSYLFYVSQAYSITIAPTESELQARLVQYAECLNQSGFDVPVGATGGDLDAVSAANADYSCAFQFSDTMVISDLGG